MGSGGCGGRCGDVAPASPASQKLAIFDVFVVRARETVRAVDAVAVCSVRARGVFCVRGFGGLPFIRGAAIKDEGRVQEEVMGHDQRAKHGDGDVGGLFRGTFQPADRKGALGNLRAIKFWGDVVQFCHEAHADDADEGGEEGLERAVPKVLQEEEDHDPRGRDHDARSHGHAHEHLQRKRRADDFRDVTRDDGDLRQKPKRDRLRARVRIAARACEVLRAFRFRSTRGSWRVFVSAGRIAGQPDPNPPGGRANRIDAWVPVHTTCVFAYDAPTYHARGHAEPHAKHLHEQARCRGDDEHPKQAAPELRARLHVDFEIAGIHVRDRHEKPGSRPSHALPRAESWTHRSLRAAPWLQAALIAVPAVLVAIIWCYPRRRSPRP